MRLSCTHTAPPRARALPPTPPASHVIVTRKRTHEAFGRAPIKSVNKNVRLIPGAGMQRPFFLHLVLHLVAARQRPSSRLVSFKFLTQCKWVSVGSVC